MYKQVQQQEQQLLEFRNNKFCEIYFIKMLFCIPATPCTYTWESFFHVKVLKKLFYLLVKQTAADIQHSCTSVIMKTMKFLYQNKLIIWKNTHLAIEYIVFYVLTFKNHWVLIEKEIEIALAAKIVCRYSIIYFCDVKMTIN